MEEKKLIDIRKIIGDKNPKLLKFLPNFLIRYIQRVLHEVDVNEVIVSNKNKHNQDFCQAVIDRFNIKIEVEGIENVPLNGGVTLAMNHPLGGMDAMALVTALKNQRSDLKFIVNDILLHLDSMNGMFVGVNKHGKNSNSNLLKIDEIFSSGNAVCIFPAGLVSRKINGKVQDLEWKKTFVSLSIKHNQPIVPVYIDGKLSNFFYRLANFRKSIGIKANIEMFFLVDELFKQKDVTMKLIFGKPIYPEMLDKSKSQKGWAEEIRRQVYSFSEK
jgi:putative hemolysin